MSRFGSVLCCACWAVIGLWQDFAQAKTEGETAQTQDFPKQSSSSAGWPHLRGPNYDTVSHETNLADSWPAGGPPVLWAREIGVGYSSLIAVDRRVFTQVQTLYGQYVVCLDADTGKQIWEHRYDWPYEGGGTYPGPRATPTFAGGRIYFAGPRGDVGCLEADSGRVVWKRNAYTDFNGRGADFGYCCSPLVEQGKVIFPIGGKKASVVALNAADGSTVWGSGSEPASYCSAIPITFQGRRHIVALLQNSLASFDLASGTLLWQHRHSQGYDEHTAFPVYEEPLLTVAFPFRGGATTYRLKDAGPADKPDERKISAEMEWQSPELSNDVASSLLLNGHIYGFDLRDIQSKATRPSRGKFKCLELKTGKVLWSSDRCGQASIIAADGKLVLLTDSGELLLLRASPERYEELARTKVFEQEICWTAAGLHQGKLYVRGPSRAVCIYLGKPDSAAAAKLENAKSVSEIKKGPRFSLAWLVAGEREYPFDPPDGSELVLWYWFCLLGVFGIAAIVAGACSAIMRFVSAEGGQRLPQRVFWIVSLLLGVVGTALFNRFWPSFVFTWPAALFVAYQWTLITILKAQKNEDRRRGRRISRAAVLILLTAAFLYFHFCLKLGMTMQWFFLIGLSLAWPTGVLAAHKLAARWHPLASPAWVILSFSAYFWLASGFDLWWFRKMG